MSFVLLIGIIIIWGKDISNVYAQVSILFVKPEATGTGDCSSWDNACTLQTALTNSLAGDQIWVAAGIYKPGPAGSPRTVNFALKAGVEIYGGFIGSETLLDQRNWTTNIVTLSGDLNGDDSGFNNNNENSYNVVTSSDINTSSPGILDGVTITGGNANGSNTLYYRADSGGGLHCESSNGLTLNSIIFNGNSSSQHGGGMYSPSCNATITSVAFIGNKSQMGGALNIGGSPILTDVRFINNLATLYGGGIKTTYGNPTLTNVTFIGNNANSHGGAMQNSYNDPILTNVSFLNNTAGGGGGGIANTGSNPILNSVTFSYNQANFLGGGMYNDQASNPELANVTFSNNTSNNSGGGVANFRSSNSIFNSVTFLNNTAPLGGGIYNSNVSNSTIYNSILWNNDGGEIYNDSTSTTNLNYSDIKGGYAGTGNLNIDPMLEPLTDNGGNTHTHALMPTSPMIDAADKTTCPTNDQRGVSRDDLHCDIGAYELKYNDSPVVIRSTNSSEMTTFGSTLMGIQRDVNFNDPGVFTITKHIGWQSQGPESIDVWWEITPTQTNNISTTLKLCYTDTESNGLVLNTLRVWKHDASGWSQVGDTPFTERDSFGNNCARISNVQTFSSWTLATTQPTAIKLNRIGASPIMINRNWIISISLTLGLTMWAILRRKRNQTTKPRQ